MKLKTLIVFFKVQCSAGKLWVLVFFPPRPSAPLHGNNNNWRQWPDVAPCYTNKTAKKWKKRAQGFDSKDLRPTPRCQTSIGPVLDPSMDTGSGFDIAPSDFDRERKMFDRLHLLPPTPGYGWMDGWMEVGHLGSRLVYKTSKISLRFWRKIVSFPGCQKKMLSVGTSNPSGSTSPTLKRFLPLSHPCTHTPA